MEHGVPTFAQGLITAWTLVGVAFLALGIVLYAAIRGRARRLNLEQAIQAFRALDIEAFRNLVDSSEEAFLRSHLSPAGFYQIKRQRARAALAYVREVGRAAAALAVVGQAAQRSPDPKVAASGAQVAESAFRLRLQTIQAGFFLLTQIALPNLESRSIPLLVDQYERSAENLFRLGRFPSADRRTLSTTAAP